MDERMAVPSRLTWHDPRATERHLNNMKSGRKERVKQDQATELEWSGVHTVYAREHVLLGSPGFIPDHLQSPRDAIKPPQFTTGRPPDT
ncbi:hypothetical protein GCM10023259_042690 [Thermocatellispora tengchongensis]